MCMDNFDFCHLYVQNCCPFHIVLPCVIQQVTSMEQDPLLY